MFNLFLNLKRPPPPPSLIRAREKHTDASLTPKDDQSPRNQTSLVAAQPPTLLRKRATVGRSFFYHSTERAYLLFPTCPHESGPPLTQVFDPQGRISQYEFFITRLTRRPDIGHQPPPPPPLGLLVPDSQHSFAAHPPRVVSLQPTNHARLPIILKETHFLFSALFGSEMLRAQQYQCIWILSLFIFFFCSRRCKSKSHPLRVRLRAK